MIEKIDGYKTYIIGIALICYAAGGFVARKLDFNTAVQNVLLGLTALGLRHSIEKVLNTK